MGVTGWLLSLAAAGAIAVAVVLAVSVRDTDEPDQGAGLVPGQIYSTDAGDPIDLVYELGDPGMGCMANLSGGIAYTGTSASCFGLVEVDEGGTYPLVRADDAEDPAVLVGVMPVGAPGATVSGIGRKAARAETRGRWFLALLEPADPSVANLETLDVDFDY